MCKRMDNEELHQLKRDLYHWAKETLRGTSIINTESGNVIEITSQGIDEWYSKSKSEEQIKSINLLTEILKAARYTHSSENIHSTLKNAPKFEYYECPIEIDEKDYKAIISIKIIVATTNNRRIYYHHYLEGLKSKTVLNSSAPTQEGK